jgi:hypothetical protein
VHTCSVATCSDSFSRQEFVEIVDQAPIHQCCLDDHPSSRRHEKKKRELTKFFLEESSWPS